MTETDVANLILGHLGVSETIADIETEESERANTIRRFKDVVRKMVLRDCDWPFARKLDELALAETDPNDEWGYSYTYPTEAVEFRRLQSGLRNDTRDTRIPYEINYHASGKRIFTDVEDAVGRFTIDVTNVSLWPPDFAMSYSLRMAHFAGPALATGDAAGLIERAERLYLTEISKAQANALNEEQPDDQPDSEFIRIRN